MFTLLDFGWVLKVLRIVGKWLPHPVGVFCMLPNPPKCHMLQKTCFNVFQYIYLFFAWYGIWKVLAACKILLRGVAVICPQFWTLVKITSNREVRTFLFEMFGFGTHRVEQIFLPAKTPARTGLQVQLIQTPLPKLTLCSIDLLIHHRGDTAGPPRQSGAKKHVNNSSCQLSKTKI